MVDLPGEKAGGQKKGDRGRGVSSFGRHKITLSGPVTLNFNFPKFIRVKIKGQNHTLNRP